MPGEATMLSPVLEADRSVNRSSSAGVSIPFDAIRAPGSYVCNWNGYLLRVPQGSITTRAQPINIVGSAPLFVTKISDDPDLPVSAARQVAVDLKLHVSF